MLLVLVGDFKDVFHTHVPEIEAAIAAAGLNDRVLLPGFVPDAELVYLYSRAYALVQPSLMEGFGLPAVEAMACGTPVVSSRAGSLPEVVGDAGLFFDPTDVASIAATIRRFSPIPGCATTSPAGRWTVPPSSPGTAQHRLLIDHFEDFERSEGTGGRRAARRDRLAFKRIEC